jgi:hypothetical protein
MSHRMYLNAKLRREFSATYSFAFRQIVIYCNLDKQVIFNKGSVHDHLIVDSGTGTVNHYGMHIRMFLQKHFFTHVFTKLC